MDKNGEQKHEEKRKHNNNHLKHVKAVNNYRN